MSVPLEEIEKLPPHSPQCLQRLYTHDQTTQTGESSRGLFRARYATPPGPPSPINNSLLATATDRIASRVPTPRGSALSIVPGDASV